MFSSPISTSYTDTEAANFTSFGPAVNDAVPYINYDNHKNILFIKGHCNEHVMVAHSQDIQTMIDQHYLDKEELKVYLYFGQMNPVTTRTLFSIFKKLQIKKSSNKNVFVTWFCNNANEEVLQSAHDFNELYQLNMSIVPV